MIERQRVLLHTYTRETDIPREVQILHCEPKLFVLEGTFLREFKHNVTYPMTSMKNR